MCPSEAKKYVIDDRQHAHQLIIIGNGFDLACNLPSGYPDFFKNTRLQVFPDSNDTKSTPWGKRLREQGLTAWDVILCEKDIKSDWCNIEREIKVWVLNYKSSDSFDTVAKLLSDQDDSVPFSSKLSKGWRKYDGSPLTDYPAADVARFIMDTTPDYKEINWNSRIVLGVMLNELHLLEERFMHYLSRSIDITENYVTKARNLLEQLKISMSSPLHYLYDFTVLNFNYTTPYPDIPKNTPHNTRFVNIHGRIKDHNAIFGIDGSNCLGNLSARPFTKTYRIMQAGTGEVSNIVYSSNSSYGKATSIIKFFGHSLNEADYSYFQAIFDTVDLYNGNTVLIFYYRPYKKEDEDGSMAREETMKRVTDLLLVYGKTLDNRDHGKNLIHRLLLEGRLLVKQI